MTIDETIQTIREYFEWRDARVMLGEAFDVSDYEATLRADAATEDLGAIRRLLADGILDREDTLRAIKAIVGVEGA